MYCRCRSALADLDEIFRHDPTVHDQRPALGGLYGASLFIARASDPRAARAEVDLVLDTLISGLLGGAVT